MLTCTGVTKAFGGLLALRDVDLNVDPGEIVGLIGPNGSGKSTLVNVISGYIRPTKGQVSIDGRPIRRYDPARIRRLGVARTFQNLRLYRQLSVLDNLLLGLHLHYTRGRDVYWGWIGEAAYLPRARRTDGEARAAAREALASVGLEHKESLLAGSLSYGDQKRLELARATLLQPRLLVLDEPTAGLAPDEAVELMALFSEPIRGSGDRALLVAEHHLELVLNVCTRVAVLNSGQKVADGLPGTIAADREVVRIYVGE